MKHFWRVWYVLRDLQCQTFGHDPYWEDRCFRAHWACKRGCGPVDHE